MSEQAPPRLKISVIVPCYNAAGKIASCLASLRRIEADSAEYEVIFIDDASTDTTVEALRIACAEQPNWRYMALDANSGSPSRPRNVGMSLARGDYVFFLDCDDEILPDTLTVHYAHAAATNADIVRGYLITDNGRQRRDANRLINWTSDLTRRERISRIIGEQSTTVVSLIQRRLLELWGLVWPEHLKLGEDTVFLTAVLSVSKVIEYIDHPTFIYHKKISFNLSSTQTYGAFELDNHLTVWDEAQRQLEKCEIDYRKLRLKIALHNVLKSLIFRNRRDLNWTVMARFAQYIHNNAAVLDTFKYGPRLRQILDTAGTGDLNLFIFACRPRLVMASRSVAVMEKHFPALSPLFDVRFDVSENVTAENEARKKIAAWTELIWCERLGNLAAWYSRHKTGEQRLVVQILYPELERQWIDDLDVNAIDAFVVDSVSGLEALLECFDTIPREKVRLIPRSKSQDFAEDIRALFMELV